MLVFVYVIMMNNVMILPILAIIGTFLCQIKIVSGKGQKDRIVPFPKSFRETLALCIESIKNGFVA